MFPDAQILAMISFVNLSCAAEDWLSSTRRAFSSAKVAWAAIASTRFLCSFVQSEELAK